MSRDMSLRYIRDTYFRPLLEEADETEMDALDVLAVEASKAFETPSEVFKALSTLEGLARLKELTYSEVGQKALPIAHAAFADIIAGELDFFGELAGKMADLVRCSGNDIAMDPTRPDHGLYVWILLRTAPSVFKPVGSSTERREMVKLFTTSKINEESTLAAFLVSNEPDIIINALMLSVILAVLKEARGE